MKKYTFHQLCKKLGIKGATYGLQRLLKVRCGISHTDTRDLVQWQAILGYHLETDSPTAVKMRLELGRINPETDLKKVNIFRQVSGTEYKSQLYRNLKGKVHPLLTILGLHSKGEYGADLFAILMSDTDAVAFGLFMRELPGVGLSDKQRQFLLDGLAQEYGQCHSWLDFVEQES